MIGRVSGGSGTGGSGGTGSGSVGMKVERRNQSPGLLLFTPPWNSRYSHGPASIAWPALASVNAPAAERLWFKTSTTNIPSPTVRAPSPPALLIKVDGSINSAFAGPCTADHSCGGEAVEEDEPPHIVDEVGHADLHRRPGDADGTDEEVHLVLLHGEDMLDARADLGLERVGLSRRLWRGAARRLLAMDAADEAVLC